MVSVTDARESGARVRLSDRYRTSTKKMPMAPAYRFRGMQRRPTDRTVMMCSPHCSDCFHVYRLLIPITPWYEGARRR